MSIKIFNIAHDNVINSSVGLGISDYEYALENIYPLINRFEAQRKFLDKKFYERLERDILKGCIMPPITLAFVEKDIAEYNVTQLEKYVEENITKGYILDGIQRLTTLHRAKDKIEFDDSKEIFFNVILANNKDKLLYRMITLNNGQKGMTPRHQIEILTQELFDFSKLAIVVQTEKDKSLNPIKNAYSLGDISRGYTAFLTGEVHNENSKIIESKMDEILVGRILDTDLASYTIQFTDIIQLMNSLSTSNEIQTWLQTSNNFIGFCVGIRKSYEYVSKQSPELIETAFRNFETAFKSINASKINLGKYRRELSRYFIENAEELFPSDSEYLTTKFFEQTVTE